MKILEDIDYSIDDALDQVKKDFGFVYVEDRESSGHFILGNQISLSVVFDRDENTLISAVVLLPGEELDLSEGSLLAEIYSSAIESSVQVVDLIKRMLGESVQDD